MIIFSFFRGEKSDLSRSPLSRSRPLKSLKQEEEVVFVVEVAIERVLKQNKKRKPTPLVASKVKYSADYSAVQTKSTVGLKEQHIYP